MFGKAIALYSVQQDSVQQDNSAFLSANIDGPLTFLMVVSVVLLVMALVFEALSMILIMVPILLATVMGPGFDPIWFGIHMVIMVECTLITPPVGLDLYVIHSVVRSSLGDVAHGVLPFLVLMLVTVGLLYAAPGLAL